MGLSVSCDQIKNTWMTADIRMTRIQGQFGSFRWKMLAGQTIYLSAVERTNGTPLL